MKVLFQPIYLETPHIDTELELMSKHLEAGDQVYVLACHRELGTCFANYTHEPIVCARCEARLAKGLAALGASVTVLRYPLPPQTRYPEVPEVVPDFDALQAIKVGPAQIGLAATSSLCTRLDTHRFDPLAHRREVATELTTAYYVYLALTRVLQTIQPDLVYIFNGRFSTALPAVNACEAMGVPFTTHDRGGILGTYFLASRALPHDLDYMHEDFLRTCHERTEAEIEQLGTQFFVGLRKGIAHSWYSYTTGQVAGRLPEGFDQSRRNVTIYNSTREEFVAIRGRSQPFAMYEGETEAVSRLCAAFASDPDYHFYLRVHPNLRGRANAQTQELGDLADRFANLTTIPPDSEVDSYALLDGSDVVVTFGSTMGIEACFWGRPSVLLGRADYERLECVYRPRTHDDVVALLRSMPPARGRSEALKYGYWSLALGTPFTRYRPESLTRGTFNGVRVADVE